MKDEEDEEIEEQEKDKKVKEKSVVSNSTATRSGVDSEFQTPKTTKTSKN